MSDIPVPTLPRKRSRRRYDKLPTPPPDPTTPPPSDDFLNYLENLQKSSVSFAPVIAAEEAFEHLEKLYKLMEQMLELREQNARLHRRVRDLEHLNNLEKMHRELDLKDESELDKDTAFAETILQSILTDPKPIKPKFKRYNRSGSVTIGNTKTIESGRRASMIDEKTKVSKWTKVKAAFKWEKASPTVTDAKSQDSGLGGVLPPPVEVARYLRVPSCDEHGHSPVDSGTAEISTPGTLSTASSTEDFHRNDPRDDFKSSDDEHSHTYTHSKEGSQKSSSKTHKTPWAKMKDMIQTRNSFKKKHRLSAQSDDIQIDVEPCTDPEDNVFMEDTETLDELPPDVIARYQQAMKDSPSKTSKWKIVKKAFLTPPSPPIEDEVQTQYKQLQKKLSLEFQEKINEWERIKQAPPSSPTTEKIDDWQKIKSQPSIKQDNLPPEFRKKLQEWEKIRKSSDKSKKKLSEVPRWKSLSAPKASDSPLDYQNLSDDFRRKLKEWKQIKAGGEGLGSTPKQVSPKQSKKQDKELQWFEKELSKIEKEKQRLERERQKFLEREEALSKLRNSVVGGLKKEVLIHTPSGFYRFEGISRKFTQKLYEWEKAQGIGPESSTFALLNSSLSYEPNKTQNLTPSNLIRSKSADSIAISALNLTCPLMSHQPSSLSLNDVDELEKQCLELDSRSSGSGKEPEALIVEIEDIVEETAGPLAVINQKKQQPVYQRQEHKLYEGETCLAPKIRRSESTKAQSNYNLIEELVEILTKILETETEIQKLQDVISELEEKEESDLNKLKILEDSQKTRTQQLIDKVQKLQEANQQVFTNLTKDTNYSKQILDNLETIQDVTSEIYHLTEQFFSEINTRNILEFAKEPGACSLTPIIEITKNLKSKILELRRSLSYICAASDLTAPRRKQKLRKAISDDSNSSEKKDDRCRLYIKSESSNQSQGAIKKRIRYRQKFNKNLDLDTDDEQETEKNLHKKLTRTRSVSRSDPETIEVDESLIQKVVVPTQIVCLEESQEPIESPVTVFVKTTRKLFTPFVEKLETPPIDDEPRLKKISPSIKLMLDKYNQKIEKKAGSESPIAWQSPSFERRVKQQTEKYQEDLKRTEDTTKRLDSQLRLEKLQKAKEEFLNSGPPSAPPLLTNEPIKFPDRNRLSQISVDSDSDQSDFTPNLIKSASAGMINIDFDTYRSIQPEVHGDGYVSLPRNSKKIHKGFLGNLAAKFRKVRMRKGKDSKVGAVSTLCRQSLVVDLGGAKSEEAAPKHSIKKRFF